MGPSSGGALVVSSPETTASSVASASHDGGACDLVADTERRVALGPSPGGALEISVSSVASASHDGGAWDLAADNERRVALDL